jgi:hypothetical protein
MIERLAAYTDEGKAAWAQQQRHGAANFKLREDIASAERMEKMQVLEAERQRELERREQLRRQLERALFWKTAVVICLAVLMMLVVALLL